MPRNNDRSAVKKSRTPSMKHLILSSLPWSCTSFGAASEIEACIGSSWVTVANIPPIPDFDGEDIASFIILAVNSYGKLQPYFQKITAVFELWQQGSSLNLQEKRQASEILAILKQETNA